MTRDFAKKSRPAPTKRTSAAKSNKAPSWVWLLTGTILGAFIMFLMYLADLAPQTTSPAKNTSQITQSNKANMPKPRFDFYKMLKESKPTSTYSNNQSDNTPTINKEYTLQAGSFRQKADADRLRAELLMLNLAAYMEITKSKQGEIWHRVLVGPYLSRSKMAKAKSILASNNIVPLLLTKDIAPPK
jgi:cell division protein FtsN